MRTDRVEKLRAYWDRQSGVALHRHHPHRLDVLPGTCLPRPVGGTFSDEGADGIGDTEERLAVDLLADPGRDDYWRSSTRIPARPRTSRLAKISWHGIGCTRNQSPSSPPAIPVRWI